MATKAVAPTARHLSAIRLPTVTCYGDDEGRGHDVTVGPDLMWLCDDGEQRGQGWICRQHVEMGRVDQAARIGRWRRAREGF